MIGFTHLSGRYFEADDAKLYFEEAGNPAGKPLVMLHGGFGSLADFNSILGNLPDQFRIIGIDFRGHGKSTLGSKPLTYKQYQSDVRCILEHLGVHSYSLFGFSDGGIVAYRLAAQQPQEVEALVTVGSQFRLYKDDPVFEILSAMTAETWKGMFPESVEYYMSVNPNPDFSALVQAVVALWTDQSSTGYPYDGITTIHAPTLIIRGDADPLLSLNEAAELQEKIEGGNFFNIPFSGHEVHKDAPDLLLAVLNEFLTHPRKLQLDT